MFSGCPSVRPSVRSLKYPLLTCTWVRWSTRPTVTVLLHVRPSVRPERFPGICRRTHEGNGLKFNMLMYLDHLHNWLVYGRGLLIFVILALFWLSETGQIWGFRAFPGERMEEMAWNFAWCILTGQIWGFWVGWVGLWGFLWWAPSAKRKDHHRVSSGWSSVRHCSNTGLSSTQYEQIPIILGVWPFWLTPFFFRSITFWRAYG